MKFFASILFCFLYLTSTSGITLNAHYCGGKVKHISFFKKSEKNCCGKKKMKKNCCKDKKNSFKVKDNHESGSFLKLKNTPLEYNNAVILIKFSFNSIIINKYFIYYYHYPPVFYDNPLYLKNQVFLI